MLFRSTPPVSETPTPEDPANPEEGVGDSNTGSETPPTTDENTGTEPTTPEGEQTITE